MDPKTKNWVNTKGGGFSLAFPDRILLHELGHAYNRDKRIGPLYNKKGNYLDLIGEEEQFVIDKYGNKYNDNLQRKDHEGACPVSICE